MAEGKCPMNHQHLFYIPFFWQMGEGIFGIQMVRKCSNFELTRWFIDTDKEIGKLGLDEVFKKDIAPIKKWFGKHCPIEVTIVNPLTLFRNG